MLNSNLNQAIVSEIIAHIRRGEFHYCKQLGFDETELSAIINLSTQEVCDLCESNASFARIQINHRVFWNLIESVRENTRERQLIDRALELGISGEMLRERFGWSSAEVSTRRKLLGIKEHIGRKKNATEEEEQAVWDSWQKHKHTLSNIDIVTSNEGLDLLMFITESTGVNLSEVWRLISIWLTTEK
ncbi:DUF2857 domain-containing protein [Pasteurella oralis]|uniref:DUF2857 domain-containing protein n=1 Tax=Pasteurella oralis TaxID=1071947 RepID=UPI000C7A9C5A|nr:DUF2857 domain-containing protein [Pasteurella oralis]